MCVRGVGEHTHTHIIKKKYSKIKLKTQIISGGGGRTMREIVNEGIGGDSTREPLKILKICTGFFLYRFLFFFFLLLFL